MRKSRGVHRLLVLVCMAMFVVLLDTACQGGAAVNGNANQASSSGEANGSSDDDEVAAAIGKDPAAALPTPAFVSEGTIVVDGFNYDKPDGWEEHPDDCYAEYTKSDSGSLVAEMFVAQSNKDHAKDKSDMSRLCTNARSRFYGGFLGDDVIEEGLNRSYLEVDGCPAQVEDGRAHDYGAFGDCNVRVFTVGAADASLLVGYVAKDGYFDKFSDDFDAVAKSVHLSQAQQDKVSEILSVGPSSGYATGGDSSGDNGSETQSPAAQAIGDGTYKVGTDIEAGEYRLTATSGTQGYWEVTNSSEADADIVGNDNFTGNTYVTVKDGQYLKLRRCTAVHSS